MMREFTKEEINLIYKCVQELMRKYESEQIACKITNRYDIPEYCTASVIFQKIEFSKKKDKHND